MSVLIDLQNRTNLLYLSLFSLLHFLLAFFFVLLLFICAPLHDSFRCGDAYLFIASSIYRCISDCYVYVD